MTLALIACVTGVTIALWIGVLVLVNVILKDMDEMDGPD